MKFGTLDKNFHGNMIFRLIFEKISFLKPIITISYFKIVSFVHSKNLISFQFDLK